MEKQLIEIIGRSEYDTFTDTFTYEVNAVYNVPYEDDKGVYYKNEYKELENLDMTSEHLKKDYKFEHTLDNHRACKEGLERIYGITSWN